MTTRCLLLLLLLLLLLAQPWPVIDQHDSLPATPTIAAYYYL
jgi:hypothetical protein